MAPQQTNSAFVNPVTGILMAYKSFVGPASTELDSYFTCRLATDRYCTTAASAGVEVIHRSYRPFFHNIALLHKILKYRPILLKPAPRNPHTHRALTPACPSYTPRVHPWPQRCHHPILLFSILTSPFYHMSLPKLRDAPSKCGSWQSQRRRGSHDLWSEYLDCRVIFVNGNL